MNVEDAVRDIAACRHRLPETSLRWACDHWDEFSPYFFDLLPRFIRGEENSRETVNVLAFSFYLANQQRDKRVFEPLCQMAHRSDLLDAIFGEDFSTESLPQFLVQAYDGRVELLRTLIEDAAADEFVRGAALDAISYLTHRGDLPHEETRVYLRELHASLRPQKTNFVFVGLAEAIMNLGLAEYRDLVRNMLQRGLIPKRMMRLGDFDDAIAAYRIKCDAGTLFSHKFEPCDDIIAEMSTWHWFTEEAAQEEIDFERRMQKRAAQQFAAIFENANSARPLRLDARPAIAEPLGGLVAYDKIGRNDPCPCGSGLKFKKCCLV